MSFYEVKNLNDIKNQPLLSELVLNQLLSLKPDNFRHSRHFKLKALIS